MKTYDEWKPCITMLAINFAFAVLNILLKKVVEEGMNNLVFITYRLAISTIFLAPIGYFVERYVKALYLINSCRLTKYLFFFLPVN